MQSGLLLNRKKELHVVFDFLPSERFSCVVNLVQDFHIVSSLPEIKKPYQGDLACD